jgi:hypothetical protein
MINRFSQFLVEEENVVYFTFGRMNPPTIGHGKLLDTLANKARRYPYRIFLSQSNDKKKNPLQYKDKVKHVRKMFPKHARSIILNNKVKTPFHALSFLYDQGYKKVVMIAGSDRITQYDIRLNKYNGKKGDHGFYNFEGGIKIISAGERDPDADGAEGASGTKQREYAVANDFTAFTRSLPSNMSNANAKRLFNDVRSGLGLKEEKQFKNHIQLEPVSDLREAYLRDNIFEEGEKVVLTKKGIVGNIKYLGTNYLIVESKNETWRCWLDDVSKIDSDITNEASMYADKPDWGTPESTRKAKKITPGETTEAQDSDIKDRPGSQPANYHRGLKKAQKIARDRQFKKQAKMSDSDPKAYKPAPGDAKAKTRLSKHTIKYRKMYGDD